MDATPLPWEAVPGWLSQAEGDRLQALAAGAIVLELGAWCGRSTLCMAAVARHVVTVDTFLGDDGAGHAPTFDRFGLNLIRSGLADRVTPILGTFEQVVPSIAFRAFDLAYVDGQHDAESTESALRLALAALRPGGTIAWHDAHYPEVQEAVARVGLTPAGLADSLSWATP